MACWDCQHRLPLPRHAEGRSWISLVIFSASKRPIVGATDTLVVRCFARVDILKSQVVMIESYVLALQMYFTIALYCKNLVQNTTISSQGSWECRSGGKRGWSPTPPIVQSRTTYNVLHTSYTSPVDNSKSIESTKFTHSTAYRVSLSGTGSGTVYITHVGRSAHDFGGEPDP